MRDGFIKVASIAPECRVADVTYNCQQICQQLDEAFERGAKVVVFPELCITAYSAGDLFFQDTLLNKAISGLETILQHTKGKKALVFVGMPFEVFSKTYNVAVALYDGKILGVIPKSNRPNYNEFGEKRVFAQVLSQTVEIELLGQNVPFGTDLLFKCRQQPNLIVACEICEDVWISLPPSVQHANAGATLVVNLSASNEVVGKAEFRQKLLEVHSGKTHCAYVYCSSSVGESTADLVFSGHCLIVEDSKLLAQSKLFSQDITTADIDVEYLAYTRRQSNSNGEVPLHYQTILFDLEESQAKLERTILPNPFIPSEKEMASRCELILTMQAHALAKRLAHVNAKCAVLGISGGLDSSLALLVAMRAKKLLPSVQQKDFSVVGITMPCFGTTERTKENSKALTKLLGAEFVKISIKTSVSRHLADIKHKKGVYDVTYENAQARERTQVLMDVANMRGGLVVGTGDLSEIALGWSTFNGDQMAMYNVNGSVPKTLIKYLIQYEAKRLGKGVQKTLQDILDTPISPELLPIKDKNTITQKSEDKIGPYQLQDFFLFYFIRYGYSPKKLYRIAKIAFEKVYSNEEIKKWLKVFVWRFFSQQFKRSCSPDCAKIGTVTLSSRGGWNVPSDATGTAWLEEVNSLA
ncbi:MAG: NAD(+) synthase [Clostridia bacterium]|nr:NAD(+) synthase [Clostridia bacterium]